MINIKRASCPPSLSKGKKLGKKYYKKQDVKDALLTMQHHKCCWCEKDMKRMGEREKWVEHLEPQSSSLFKYANGKINWSKANAWINLLYACNTCNGTKSTLPMFHPVTDKRLLIDPSYVYVDPERHITFKVKDFMITYKAKNKSKLGLKMLKELKLKARTDLYANMRDAIRQISISMANLHTAVENNDGMHYAKTAEELRRATCASCPHAAFKRYYIRMKIEEFNSKYLPKYNAKYQRNFGPVRIQLAKKAEKIT